MKKIIIPLASLTAGAIVAVGLTTLNLNKAVADIPEVPLEINDGNYYIGGDPSNNDLYLVIEDGTIRYQSDTGDLRNAFRNVELNCDEQFRVSEENLEHQLDITMADWGDTYNYVLGHWSDSTDRLIVYTKTELNENGEPQGGQGFMYYIDKKSLHSWEGDYILYEGETVSTDDPENENLSEENTEV